MHVACEGVGHQVVCQLLHVVLARGRGACSAVAADAEHLGYKPGQQQVQDGEQCHLHAGGVAAGVGYPGGGADLGAGSLALRQAVDPGRVEPVVCAEVNDLGGAAGVVQGLHIRRGQVVRQGQDPHVDVGVRRDLGRAHVVELQVREGAVAGQLRHVAHFGAFESPRGGHGDGQLRVLGDDVDQLRACVTPSPDQADIVDCGAGGGGRGETPPSTKLPAHPCSCPAGPACCSRHGGETPPPALAHGLGHVTNYRDVDCAVDALLHGAEVLKPRPAHHPVLLVHASFGFAAQPLHCRPGWPCAPEQLWSVLDHLCPQSFFDAVASAVRHHKLVQVRHTHTSLLCDDSQGSVVLRHVDLAQARGSVREIALIDLSSHSFLEHLHQLVLVDIVKGGVGADLLSFSNQRSRALVSEELFWQIDGIGDRNGRRRRQRVEQVLHPLEPDGVSCRHLPLRSHPLELLQINILDFVPASRDDATFRGDEQHFRRKNCLSNCLCSMVGTDVQQLPGLGLSHTRDNRDSADPDGVVDGHHVDVGHCTHVLVHLLVEILCIEHTSEHRHGSTSSRHDLVHQGEILLSKHLFSHVEHFRGSDSQTVLGL
mmetsp:Transcript_19868/g.39363  ORF Transcript_19868/g.39363 Transcript_19868/m.39363 type:complete len:597 (-) Transcript_19868:403-2193(-)